MGLGNILIIAQVTSYLLLFIFSFFVFIPLTVNQNEFNGHCLLFANGNWEISNDTQPPYVLKILEWGDHGACNFPILVGVVAFPLSLFYLLWMSVYLFKGTEPSWLAAFLSLLANMVMLVASTCSAAVVTAGYQHWCNVLSPRITCAAADYTGNTFLAEGDISTRHFYIEFGLAQFGLWSSFVCWLAQVMFAIYQMWLYNHTEDFLISMHRERQRLIQKVSRPRDVVL